MMCAILDANVASEVFSRNGPTAGTKFLDWVEKGGNHLVVGGKLTDELSAVSKELKQLGLAGRTKIINADEIEIEEKRLQSKCKSNDPHIIALARISGARLLYSNDVDLQEDFKRKELISGPRGKIYTTLREKSFGSAHKKLLRQKNLCRPRR